MISFNLYCEKGHEFEGWFSNSDAFEKQRKKKLVECPVCSSRKIEKGLSAPNITTGESRDLAKSEKVTQMKKMFAVMRDQVRANCDYVGDNFAEEARKIHYGEAEERGIYGSATMREAAELVEEGVEVNPIPWMEEPTEQ